MRVFAARSHVMRGILAVALVSLGDAAVGAPATFILDLQTNAWLTVTIYADDGVATAEASQTVSPIPAGAISGDLAGVISPVFTIQRIEYSFSDLGLDYSIGTAQVPVSLDLTGFIAWSPVSGNQVTLTQLAQIGQTRLPMRRMLARSTRPSDRSRSMSTIPMR